MKKSLLILLTLIFLTPAPSFAMDSEKHNKLKATLDAAANSMELFGWDAITAYREAQSQAIASDVWLLLTKSMSLAGTIEALSVSHKNYRVPPVSLIEDVLAKLLSLDNDFDIMMSDETKAFMRDYLSLNARQLEDIHQLLKSYKAELVALDASQELTKMILRRIQDGTLEEVGIDDLRIERLKFYEDEVECVGRSAIYSTRPVGTCLVYGQIDNAIDDTLFQVSLSEDERGRYLEVTIISTEN